MNYEGRRCNNRYQRSRRGFINRSNKLNSSPDLQSDILTTFPRQKQQYRENFFERTPSPVSARRNRHQRYSANFKGGFLRDPILIVGGSKCKRLFLKGLKVSKLSLSLGASPLWAPRQDYRYERRSGYRQTVNPERAFKHVFARRCRYAERRLTGMQIFPFYTSSHALPDAAACQTSSRIPRL